MIHYQREEFKHLAAGQFCYGKPSIDIKELKTYVEGALMAFDALTKQTMKNKIENKEEGAANVSQDSTSRITN